MYPFWMGGRGKKVIFPASFPSFFTVRGKKEKGKKGGKELRRFRPKEGKKSGGAEDFLCVRVKKGKEKEERTRKKKKKSGIIDH